MNIKQIYTDKEPIIEKGIADMYNLFAKDIDNDTDYTLADDELSELFGELVLMYMKNNTSSTEWNRITKPKTEIDYYGEEDNYIHLKFGDARKMYFFTEKFKEDNPYFSEEYKKYWESEPCDFKNAKELVEYVFKNEIPVHFYFNYTDTPVESESEIMEWIEDNN